MEGGTSYEQCGTNDTLKKQENRKKKKTKVYSKSHAEMFMNLCNFFVLFDRLFTLGRKRKKNKTNNHHCIKKTVSFCNKQKYVFYLWIIYRMYVITSYDVFCFHFFLNRNLFNIILENVCNRPWTFERVPNKMLRGLDNALIFTATKESCLAACLNEV